MARPKAFDTDQALDLALQIFWKKGYDGASMQDLVDGMGINRASLYATFGDKQQLYHAALRRYQQQNRQVVQRIARSPATPAQRLHALLHGVIEEALNDPDQKGCFMVNSAVERGVPDPEIGRIVCDNTTAFARELAGLLTAGQASGEFRADLDPLEGASFLLHQINGMRVLAKVRPERAVLESSVALALRALK